MLDSRKNVALRGVELRSAATQRVAMRSGAAQSLLHPEAQCATCSEMNMEVKTTPVSFRLKRSLVDQLRRATERGNLRLSQTALVERGIALVLQELENGDHVQPARRTHRK